MNAVDKEKWTPLITACACSDDNDEIVDLLLQHQNADIFLGDKAVRLMFNYDFHFHFVSF